MTQALIPADSEKNKVEDGTLYLVATPIGNLSDLSPRAAKVLSQVSFIAAEDTRQSMKLLSFLGIKKEMISYYEHNKAQRGPAIVARLAAGESCALLTDAGTPAISDPGEDLVRLAAEAGITITALPGCCAAINALALSALPTGRFAFEGFLSAVKSERRKQLSALTGETRTLIFYEAPHKLRATLADMLEAFGARRISLCRELTKKNEEILRTDLASAVALYEQREPRGEYVLVMEGAARTAAPHEDPETDMLTAGDPEAHLAHYEAKGLSRMEAMKAAARDRGMTKSQLYKLLEQKK